MSRDELVEQAMRVHEAAVKDGVGGNVLTMGEVSALIARIRELEAGLREIMDGASEHVPYLLARARALEAGLAWYAEMDNYLGHCPAALADRGTRARAALAGEA